jgi:hypothetical protein
MVEDWIGVPMYFGGIGDEATLAAVRAAGLTVEASEVVPQDEPDGHISRFHWITATKPAPGPGSRPTPHESSTVRPRRSGSPRSAP